MYIWTACIIISVALLAVTAGSRAGDVNMAYANMAVAALVNLVFVILALRSNSTLRANGASRSAIAADGARSMSIIWIWGVIGIAVIYGTGILQWKEWWHFLLAFMAVAGLCVYSGLMLQRRADAGQDDESLLKQGHYATIGQLVGMIVIVVGLLVDGKMVRFYTERYTDWAANNIFFFGAAAIGVLCAYLIMNRQK